MTRRMSCALTVDAVINRTKTVTRRHPDTWRSLRPGDHLTLIEKGMGLARGERQRILAPDVLIVSNRVEPLILSARPGELEREGLRHLSHAEFVDLWCNAHGYRTVTDGFARLALLCRRIEWTYTDLPDLEAPPPPKLPPLTPAHLAEMALDPRRQQ